MQYIAHIRESDQGIQTVEAHLLGVKKLAEEYGAKIGVEHIAGLAGLLHDLGKYTNEFRTYLLEAVANPSKPPKRGEVDHSTAGGKLLYDIFKKEKSSKHKVLLAEIVGNAIISHHSYLHDFLGPEAKSDYLRRVRDKELAEFEMAKQLFFELVINEKEFHSYIEAAVNELEAFIPSSSSDSPSKLMFLTKFVFSALIDADRTNTREFENNFITELEQSRKQLFNDYHRKLMLKIEGLQASNQANSLISSLRQQMSQMCERFASRPSGIYTLSIPTGGGKTLASFRYGLQHAIQYEKKHIIYVVPYTTIIEQNAEEIRKIIQDDANLLEHHSNVIHDTQDNDEMDDGMINTRQKLKLARENWDAPIIFTTMVQFLNTFYARGSRNIRRLHNLSESVIIFDEVQKVPIPCVSLFNRALNFLKSTAHSSLVLCTATQPALDFVQHKLAIKSDAEMIDNLPDVVQAFKRVEVIDRATGETFNTDKLADFVLEQIQSLHSVLVILNTKAVVKKLYKRISSEDIPVFHLSTAMCASHRNYILKQVKDLLAAEKKVICISTQLIEAGVDISFDCVVRSLAGLDSIAQAAGRCNRHGKDEIRYVYVVNHEEENLKRLKEIRVGKQVSERIFKDLCNNSNEHGGHILSKQAMVKYFEEFYMAFKEDLNYNIKNLKVNMTQLLMFDRRESPYYGAYTDENKVVPLMLTHSHRTAAEHFEVIDNVTTSVIVPYGRGGEIIAELNGGDTIDNLSQLLREAQQYSVNVFEDDCKLLTKNDGWVKLLDGKVFALKDGAYNDEFGLDIENESGISLNMW